MSPIDRSAEEVERLRRSIAMLAPGQPALRREDALELLGEVQQLRRDLLRLEQGLRALLHLPEAQA